jgi:hypothetical protein
LDGSCGGSSGSGSCGGSGSVGCQGISGCCILQGKDFGGCDGSGSVGCFLQGKDFSLELIDEFVGLVCHLIASIDDGYELEEAVEPKVFFSDAAIDRRVKDKIKMRVGAHVANRAEEACGFYPIWWK